MKTLILSFILLSISLFSNCRTEESIDNFESSAFITGPNYGACICCTGWFIEIDGESETKWFETLPVESEIDLNTSAFPISVWINWTAENDACPSIVIIDDILLVR